MKSVADSSVLISLGAIGLLSLLPSRFTDGVMAPPVVWKEVVEMGAGRTGAEAVATSPWIEVVEPTNRALVLELQSWLGPGEAAVIALALEHSAVALLDEREGRKRATHLGLTVLGTLGILIWARRESIILSLDDTLNAWQQSGCYRISDALRQQALESVGET